MIFQRQCLTTNFLTSSFCPYPLSRRTSSKTLSPQTLLKSCNSLSILSFNLFLSFLLRGQKISVLLGTFSQFASNSIQFDSRTHFLVTHALLISRRYQEAERFIIAAEKYEFVVRKSLWDSLIREICVTVGDPEKALYLMRECVQNRGISLSLITFRSLILSFSSLGKMEKAIDVLETMTSDAVGYQFDNTTCSFIVSRLSKIGKSGFGLEFYDKVQRNRNFQPNLITYTAVVDALCREGRIDEASNVVQNLEKDGIVLDSVLYTSWICGFFQKGLLMEGVRKHWLMSRNGVIPDLVSYSSLINGLCKVGLFEKVVGIIKYIEKSGLKPNLIIYTSIIHGFCKQCKMEEAFALFRMMKELNIVADEFTYSALIDGLCTTGKLNKVFRLLEEMERKGIKATIVTYNTVINGLCKSGKTSLAEKISRNIFGDNFTYSILIHSYMLERDEQGVLNTKRRLEQAGIPFDIVTVNLLIKALFVLGMPDDACSLFIAMPEKGLIADLRTYYAMVDGYCKLGMIDRALEVFMEFKRTSFFINDVCHARMIVGLCKHDKVDKAMELFLEICEKQFVVDTFLYRKMMRTQFKHGNWESVLKNLSRIERCDSEVLSFIGNDCVLFLCQRGCFPAALEAYIFMRMKGLTVWSKPYYILFKSLVNIGNSMIFELVFCDYIKACGILDSRILNITCLYFCKNNVKESPLYSSGKRSIFPDILIILYKIFEENCRVPNEQNLFVEKEEESTTNANVISYSMVVDGLCKLGFLERALNFYSDMSNKGINANIVIYNSIIHSLCHQGCFVEAFKIFDSLECHGLYPTIVTYAIIISALTRVGFLQDAKQMLDRMHAKGIYPNINIFNYLVNGYCRHGLLDEGLQLVSDLTRFSLEPNGFTISSILYGYCTKGDMQGALHLYNVYREKKHSPDFLGFLYLIKGLHTKGRMEETRNIIMDMLQYREAVEFINNAGVGLSNETSANSLKFFCEGGRLQEAISILNDIGAKFISSWWFKNSSRHREIGKELLGGAFTTNAGIKGNAFGGRMLPSLRRYILQYVEDDIAGRTQKFYEGKIVNSEMQENKGSIKLDFETYYSIVAVLCSKGELQKANDIVKAMTLSSEKVS